MYVCMYDKCLYIYIYTYIDLFHVHRLPYVVSDRCIDEHIQSLAITETGYLCILYSLRHYVNNRNRIFGRDFQVH